MLTYAARVAKRSTGSFRTCISGTKNKVSVKSDVFILLNDTRVKDANTT